MNDLLKWILKVALQAVIWVFVLSINVSGRPLFSHAYDTFVDNEIVHAVDAELADLWIKVRRTAQTTFADPVVEEETTM